MEITLHLAIALFGAAGIAWSTYWFMLRPYFLDKCVLKIQRARDEYLEACLERIQGCEDRLAQEFFNEMTDIESFRQLSFSMVVVSTFQNRAKEHAETVAFRERLEKSPVWLRRLFQEKGDAMLAIVILNSPIWWPVLYILLVGALLSPKLRSYKDLVSGSNSYRGAPTPC
jgi:hypothetical protein